MTALWPVIRGSLRRRPLRSALNVLAVTLGVGILIATQLTVAALGDQASAAAAQRAGDATLDVRATAGFGLSTADQRSLQALAGVAEAEPLVEKRVAALPTGGSLAGTVVTLVGIDDRGRAALRPVEVVQGRLPSPSSRSEVALDQGLAGALGAQGGTLRLGDRILLTTATGPDDFTVVGFTSGTTAGAAFTRSAAFVTPAELAGSFSLGLHTPLMALRLTPGASVPAVAAAARAAVPGAVVESARGSGADPLDQLHPLVLLLMTIATLVGAGVTANSVALSVSERRREIGLLRAAGASGHQVFAIFAGEGAVTALTGAALGIGAGWLCAAVLSSRYAPAGVSPSLRWDTVAVLLAVVAGVAASLLGAALAALPALSVPPLAAVRAPSAAGHEPLRRRPLYAALPAAVIGAVMVATGGPAVVAWGCVLLLAAAALALPLVAPQVARAIGGAVAAVFPQAPAAAANVARRRNRTALCVAGLTVAVAAAVALSALSSAALDAGDGWVTSLLGGSTLITAPVTQPRTGDLLGSVQAVNGVVAVTPIRLFAEPVDGRIVGIAAVDPLVYRANGGLAISGDRDAALTALATTPSVLVPAQVAAQTGWTAGERLQAQRPDGGATTLTVRGVLDHSFPAGDGTETLLMAQSQAVATFGDTAAGFDDLAVFTSGDRTASLADLAARYGWQATSAATIRDAARAALGHVIGLLLALSGVAVVIALLAVVNTLLVTVQQEARTVALLRAVGMAGRTAVQLTLLEAGLVAATGALLGVGLGALLTVPMLHVSGSPGFTPAYTFPVLTTIAIAVLVVVAAVVAVIAPARRAAAGSIVAGIRWE